MPRTEQLAARKVGTCSHIWRRIERKSWVDLKILPGVERETLYYVTTSMSCLVVVLVNIILICVIEKEMMNIYG